MSNIQNQLVWKMNPDYTGQPINIDWPALAKTLDITLQQLNQYWNNGSIFVFHGIQEICDYYCEWEPETPAADILKEEIKQKTVIYTQHIFFMWA